MEHRPHPVDPYYICREPCLESLDVNLNEVGQKIDFFVNGLQALDINRIRNPVEDPFYVVPVMDTRPIYKDPTNHVLAIVSTPRSGNAICTDLGLHCITQ